MMRGNDEHDSAFSESASLLGDRGFDDRADAHAAASSAPPATAAAAAVAAEGVPLRFVQLDDRFRVSRLVGAPMLLCSLALMLSDLVLMRQQESGDDSAALPAQCATLLSAVRGHLYVSAALLLVALAILFRPVGHKAFPLVAAIISAQFLMAGPAGCALLWSFGACRSSAASAIYWHCMLLAWLHFWPPLALGLLFNKGIREWTAKGWREGRRRGFFSREIQAKPFIGNTQR